MLPRSPGRKIAHAFSLLTLASGLISSGVFLYFLTKYGIHDVVTASLLATMLFFFSCSFVLYTMGKPPLHELKPWDSED